MVCWVDLAGVQDSAHNPRVDCTGPASSCGEADRAGRACIPGVCAAERNGASSASQAPGAGGMGRNAEPARRFGALVARCRCWQQGAFQRLQALVNLRERDFDGAETVVHAAYVRFEALNASIDAANQNRHYGYDNTGHGDDRADHRSDNPLRVGAHVEFVVRRRRSASVERESRQPARKDAAHGNRQQANSPDWPTVGVRSPTHGTDPSGPPCS